MRTKDKFVVHAVKCMANTCGVAMEISDDGESARIAWYVIGEKISVMKWKRIKHTRKRYRPYIKYNKGCGKHFIDEYVRVDIA